MEHPFGVFYNDGALTKQGYGAVAASISMLACAAIYILSPVISPRVFKTYNKLSKLDQRDWDMRIIGLAHAVIVTALSIHISFFHDIFTKEDPIPFTDRSCPLTYTTSGIALGYFIFDFGATLVFMVGGMAMVFHHVAALTAVGYATYRGQALVYIIWILVTECTTPFINMRWWLDKADLKLSVWYKLNGALLLISWVLGRLIVFFPFFAHLYNHWELVRKLDTLGVSLLISINVLLFCLNTFWFTKIVRGALKVFSKPATKKE